MQIKNKQHGFNIIELMIALLLGAILLTGATSIYVNTKQTFRITEGQSAIQENGRFALEFITRDIRRAGSMGCMSDVALYIAQDGEPMGAEGVEAGDIEVLVKDPNNFVLKTLRGDSLSGIEAFKAGSNLIPVEFQGMNPTPKIGTDLLILRGELGKQGVITQAFSGGAGAVQVTPRTFEQNDVVMISNCARGTVFQITNADAGSGSLEHGTTGSDPNNSSTNIHEAAPYMPGDPISQILTVVYYIAYDPVGNVPTLYRGIDGMDPVPLIPYVENLQVLLGQSTDPNDVPSIPLKASRFVEPESVDPPSKMPAGANIVAAKIALLIRSEEEYYVGNPKTRSYEVPGLALPLDFTDLFKRQVYTSTVALRNRTMR